jgi:zinc/manganese transport system permease protein
MGLFVVFAALIAPALWQQAGVAGRAARAGTMAACGAGLGASWLLDAPSGACVALALSACGTLGAFFEKMPP